MLTTLNNEMVLPRDQTITNTDIVDIKVHDTIMPKKKNTVTRVLTDTAIALGDLQVLKPMSPTEERRATLRAISRQKNQSKPVLRYQPLVKEEPLTYQQSIEVFTSPQTLASDQKKFRHRRNNTASFTTATSQNFHQRNNTILKS